MSRVPGGNYSAGENLQTIKEYYDQSENEECEQHLEHCFIAFMALNKYVPTKLIPLVGHGIHYL